MAVPAQVLVVADGDVDRSLLRTLGGAVGPMLIAADGGAPAGAGRGPRPGPGSGRSRFAARGRAAARLEALGVELQVAAPDKDESDMELCLLAALASGARRIVVLGALGLVRPEHSVANLLLLADPRLDGLEVDRGRPWLAHHPGIGTRRRSRRSSRSPGEPGDLVSLLPAGRRGGGRHHARPALPAGRRDAAPGPVPRPLQRTARADRVRDLAPRPSARHPHPPVDGRRHPPQEAPRWSAPRIAAGLGAGPAAPPAPCRSRPRSATLTLMTHDSFFLPEGVIETFEADQRRRRRSCCQPATPARWSTRPS